MSGFRMLAGSITPEVCVPTWFGVLCAVVAIVTLALLVRSWRRRRREKREGRKREEGGGLRGWARRLSPGDWINLALLVLSVGGIVAGIVHCRHHVPRVRISLADSRLNPAEYDNSSDEYVCLVNRDDHAVSLAGWELRAVERRINVLPDFTLKQGAAVRVHPGEGTNSRRDLYGEKGSPQWRNTGGQISLLDSEGRTVDSVGYGERKQDDGSGKCGTREKNHTEVTDTGKSESPPQPPPPPCDQSYAGACLDPNAEDYDCAGGEGDGPEYVEGPITVVGEDHFELDSDGNGTACEP